MQQPQQSKHWWDTAVRVCAYAPGQVVAHLMQAGRSNKVGAAHPTHQRQGFWLLIPARPQPSDAQQQRVRKVSVQVQACSARHLYTLTALRRSRD